MEEQQLDEVRVLDDICEADEFSWRQDEDTRSISGHFNIIPDVDHLEIHVQRTVLPQLPIKRKAKIFEDGRAILPIKYLLPFQLDFTLPTDYPDEAKPEFTLACPYLSAAQLSSLCKQLDDMWEDIGHAEVLYMWLMFFKSESLTFLGIESRLPIQLQRTPGSTDDIDPRVKLEPYSPLQLTNKLLSFDVEEDNRRFEQATNSCAICFSDKPGTECSRFLVCGHIFCKECIGTYFQTQIETGQIRQMVCPDVDCDNVPLPTEIQQVVPPEVFAKYDARLLELTLAEMSDVVTCPRDACQKPVIIESEVTMGRCAACTLTFCVLCRRAYHGVNECKITDFVALLKEYKGADEEHKALLEKRYGKKRFERAAEEEASLTYLRDQTVPCPGCGTYTSKIDGCNKMTCSKCGAYFCYLCQAKLSHTDPYKHFSYGACRSRLFEGMGIGQDPQPDWDWADADDDDGDDAGDVFGGWEIELAALLGPRGFRLL
eukprot:m.79653 g.79653  ORF g.79653 m.79653 type:complete len:487 (-) comp14168_c0_seq2:355-1815(-)